MTCHLDEEPMRGALTCLVLTLQLAQTACSSEAPSPDVRTVRQAQSVRHTETQFSWGENNLGDAISCAAVKNGQPTASDDVAITFYHDDLAGSCFENRPWMLDHAQGQMGLGGGGTWNVITGPGYVWGVPGNWETHEGEPMVRIKKGTGGGIGFYLANGPSRWVSDAYYESSPHIELSVKHAMVDENPVMKPFANTNRIMRFSYENEVKKVHHSTSHADNNMKVDYRLTLIACPSGNPSNCQCGATAGACQLNLGLFSYFRQDSSNLGPGNVHIYSYGGKPKISYLPGADGTLMKVVQPGPDTIEVGTSRGETVQQVGEYSLRRFEIEVTWTQFKALLKAAADQDGVTRTEMFGSAWSSRSSWLLMTPRIVVEGRNDGFASTRHYIGGRFSWVKVLAE